MRRVPLPLLGPLLLAAVLFLTNLGGYSLWPPDEPRFGQVAREIMQSGEPIVLHINGEVYKEKPPLLFWSIALASWARGDVNEWTARIPSAVAALLTVVFTFLLARRLYGARVAGWSAVVLCTLMLFWWEARSVRTDMLLTACLTAALYAFWIWHEDRRPVALLLFYGAIAAALYAKGPPALVFPLLMTYAFYWGQRAERKRMHLWIGLAVAIGAISIWLALMHARIPADAQSTAIEGAVGGNLFRQTIGRFFLGVSKAQWPWYYLENLPVNWLPWTVLLPWTVVWVWKHRRDGLAMRLLLSWILPAFIFFTICVGKRPMYLLPLYPAVAILFARSGLALLEEPRARARRWMLGVWGAGLIAMGVAAFVSISYAELTVMNMVFFGALLVVLGLATLAYALFTPGTALMRVLAASFAACALAAAMWVFPALDGYKGAKEFCEPVRTAAMEGRSFDLYSVGFSREEYIFYSHHFHTPVLCDLLPIEGARDIPLDEMARLQRKLRKALTAAFEDRPIGDGSTLTDAQLAELRARVHEALAGAKAPPELAAAFEASMQKTLDDLAAKLLSDTPAYMFVQEEDWRWILPLEPQLRKLTALKNQGVGSRDVLLLANDAAQR